MTTTAVPAEMGSFSLRHLVFAIWMEALRDSRLPSITWNVIKAGRGDESTNPSLLHDTASLFIGVLMIARHNCFRCETSFVSPPRLLQPAVQHICDTIKYAWWLPWHCPFLRQVQLYVAYQIKGGNVCQTADFSTEHSNALCGILKIVYKCYIKI